MSRKDLPSLLWAALACALAATIFFALPHDRHVESLGLLLFKLTPFLVASVALATLRHETIEALKMPLWALPAAFLGFFCWFVPKIFFYAEDYPKLYYVMLMATPFVILALLLSFRMGGGSSSVTLRLAFAMLLLMLSGLEDLAYLVVNKHTDPTWATIPEVWTWASHISVFLGHPPSKHEAYGFIAVHVVLAVVVLTVPLRMPRLATLLSKGGRHADP